MLMSCNSCLCGVVLRKGKINCSRDNMNIIKDCQSYFNLKLPSESLTKRYDKFLLKLSTTNNVYCAVFA